MIPSRVLVSRYGHFSGINRKVQLTYLPHGQPKTSSEEEGTAEQAGFFLFVCLFLSLPDRPLTQAPPFRHTQGRSVSAAGAEVGRRADPRWPSAGRRAGQGLPLHVSRRARWHAHTCTHSHTHPHPHTGACRMSLQNSSVLQTICACVCVVVIVVVTPQVTTLASQAAGCCGCTAPTDTTWRFTPPMKAEYRWRPPPSPRFVLRSCRVAESRSAVSPLSLPSVLEVDTCGLGIFGRNGLHLNSAFQHPKTLYSSATSSATVGLKEILRTSTH